MKQKLFRCEQCRKTVSAKKTCVVDDKHICVDCFYQGAEPFEIYPIGIVKNDLQRQKVGFGTTGKRGISRIELIESQRPFLYKLEDEKLITIIYYLHETESVDSIFNRGLDDKRVGVFASRTPYRLSKIAIQDVRLVKVDGLTLYLEGLDAVDGTPVLDIKMFYSAVNKG